MELQLDRKIANRRMFTAIDLVSSSTRRDDLLLDENTTQRVGVLDKNNNVEGWMCPHCNSLFDLDENLTYISLPNIELGKA